MQNKFKNKALDFIINVARILRSTEIINSRPDFVEQGDTAITLQSPMAIYTLTKSKRSFMIFMPVAWILKGSVE